MRNLLITFGIILCFTSCQRSLKSIVKEAEKATFIIYTYDEFGSPRGSGSGFFIEKTGIGITNYHVLDGAVKAVIKTTDNAEYEIEQVIASNQQWDRDYLFTHAGMSIAWSILHESDITWIDGAFSETLNRTWKENPKVFYSVGRYRGGDGVGSPIWADAREHDTQGISDTTIQIFGHTQLMEKPYINGNMWCVDCRKVFMLENGELKEY